MNYPKWLEEEAEWIEDMVCSFGGGEAQSKMVQMAKDAWAMAYNAGVEGSMTPGEFCEKYQDEVE